MTVRAMDCRSAAVAGAVALRDDDREAAHHAGTETDDQKRERGQIPHRAQRPIAQPLPYDHRVRHRIDLLQQVGKQYWEKEAKDQLWYASVCQIISFFHGDVLLDNMPYHFFGCRRFAPIIACQSKQINMSSSGICMNLYGCGCPSIYSNFCLLVSEKSQRNIPWLQTAHRIAPKTGSWEKS